MIWMNGVTPGVPAVTIVRDNLDSLQTCQLVGESALKRHPDVIAYTCVQGYTYPAAKTP
jgi:hypothetical protein